MPKDSSHALAAANAQHAASVNQATAIKGFYHDSAVTATAYLTELADALHAHSAAAAAADKVYAHGIADGSANASHTRYFALNAASNAYTTGRNAARAAWSTGLADAQVHLRTASATAQRDRRIASLAADEARIIAQNDARKVFLDARSRAYHASETAAAGHDHAFYLAEINATAATASGLRDPWSVRDDQLRRGRAESDRQRLAASLSRTRALVTAQRDVELAYQAAETDLRNRTAESIRTHGTSVAQSDLTLAIAQAHAAPSTAAGEPSPATVASHGRGNPAGHTRRRRPNRPIDARRVLASGRRPSDRPNGRLCDVHRAEKVAKRRQAKKLGDAFCTA